MSTTPLPPQQRAARMKVLEQEADQLQRVEEVLIAREGAERSTNCAPAAVLGVRVTDAHGGRVTPDQQRDLRLSASSVPRGCGVRFRQLRTHRRVRRWPLSANALNRFAIAAAGGSA